MRTYTHALVSYHVARRVSGKLVAASVTAGAAMPDLPALTGSAWLLARRGSFEREAFHGEVCARSRFRRPDAAPSITAECSAALPVALAAGRLGWAGHGAADLLTHGSDARPVLWPVSRRRFESPVSYSERDRHGAAFTIVEHGALLALLWSGASRADE
ncbi:MAG: hypothetical protein L0G70_05425 [Rubrobacter sp.]|nr:hypothetical protein [Rubrobacter sp.]